MLELTIEKTSLPHIKMLKTWFPDENTLRHWGGPGFRHPFTTKTFLEDMRWERIPSYSGLDHQQQLLAFGQYYANAGHCHLARLAVDPHFRSMGIGSRFISEIMNVGKAKLGYEYCSLFVMTANKAAFRCYQKLGFTKKPWPTWLERIEGIIYMSTE